MELFVFIRMGGARERILVVEISSEAGAALAKFDAARARCFLQKDRQHLLAVMEAGFGDLRPFNKVVRTILNERKTVLPASNSFRSMFLSKGLSGSLKNVFLSSMGTQKALFLRSNSRGSSVPTVPTTLQPPATGVAQVL